MNEMICGKKKGLRGKIDASYFIALLFSLLFLNTNFNTIKKTEIYQLE